ALKVEHAPAPDVDDVLGAHLVAAETADAVFVVDNSLPLPDLDGVLGAAFGALAAAHALLFADFRGGGGYLFGRRPQKAGQPVDKVRAGGLRLDKVRLGQGGHRLLYQLALLRGEGPQAPAVGLLQHEDALRLHPNEG